MISNYSEPATAKEDWNMLKGLVADDVIKVGALALVNRDHNGKVHVKDTTNEPGIGAVAGVVGGAFGRFDLPAAEPPAALAVLRKWDALALTCCASIAAQC